MGLNVNVQKMMMRHPISEKLDLSHQADHECLENCHPLTYKYAPVISIPNGQAWYKKAS